MEYQAGNCFVRPNHCDKGQKITEHMHEFSHCTFFYAGSFDAKAWHHAVDEHGEWLKTDDGKDVWVLKFDRVFSAGQWCLIEPNVKHEFTSREDGSSFACIYSHRDPQSEDVVQDYNGWIKAYE